MGKQFGGMGIIIVWTVVTITIAFLILKKTIGLHVTAEEVEEAKEAGVDLPVESAIPVVRAASVSGKKLTQVTIITRQNKFDALKRELNAIGITGMTVSNVMGCGYQKGASEFYRGTKVEIHRLPKIKVEIVVSKVTVEHVIDAARKALYTGHIGDGKIFVTDIADAIKVRTGETGYDALQDEA